MPHAKRKASMLKKHGLKGVNKSHVVLAQEGHKIKLIRFGQQGVSGDKGNTARSRSFKARHKKNIKKGKMSAAFWANKTKW
jgi:hypothetical protein